MKRPPLKSKRDTPRRNEGRVTHARIKRKATDKSEQERRYHAYVAALPCVGCGVQPVCIHHVISNGYQRITKDHTLVLPLCPSCHADGPTAVHRIGTRVWNAMHGFEQHIRAAQLWETWNG